MAGSVNAPLFGRSGPSGYRETLKVSPERPSGSRLGGSALPHLLQQGFSSPPFRGMFHAAITLSLIGGAPWTPRQPRAVGGFSLED